MGVIDDYLEDLGDSQRAELERVVPPGARFPILSSCSRFEM
jgi:hypothetical protein